jgi:PAS domain S-box-containing protein
LEKAMIELRDQLKNNKAEEEKLKQDESQRHWVASGLAQFSGLLRQSMNDMGELSAQVVSYLVNYMHVNQAGFYNLHDVENQEKHFKLSAIYAYGRHKYPDQILAWGEGLVGACALERETIYLQEVPEGYTHITSGLGEATPSNILIVPLKYNEEIHGVIELAAFKLFEDYQIQFVERIAESVASTLSGVKTNEQTAKLLRESQSQAEMMREQEDLMKQNMIELEATQIEAAKQGDEFISFSNAVNAALMKAEFDLNGQLIFYNDRFENCLGLAAKQGTKFSISTLIDRKRLNWFERYWSDIIAQKSHFEGEIPMINTEGNHVWVMGTFTSMFNQENQIEKVLFLGLDVSMRKNKDQQNTSLIEAINQSTLKMEFDIEGQFISINERLMKALQLSNDEVKKMSIKDFILDDPRRNFATIWKNISRSIPYEGRIGMRNKQHDVLWFYGNFSHINSQISQSEEKVVLIASDITRQVEIEEKSKTQTKRLMEQEELLKAHSEELSQKLREAKEEMRTQYKEIEIVKALNEKTLEGALDAIIAINQFGKIEFFNEAAEELWDIAKRDILGKHIVELLPEIHATLGDNYMGAYLRISDSTVLRQRNEVFFINQDGQKENVLITLSEAKDGDNYRLTGFIQKVELELF